jgi:hypothetical protein
LYLIGALNLKPKVYSGNFFNRKVAKTLKKPIHTIDLRLGVLAVKIVKLLVGVAGLFDIQYFFL